MRHTHVRAAILHESPGALVIDDVEVGDLAPDEVLVRTSAAGLCHSDLHHLKTAMPGQFLPRVLGHESAGVVEALGASVVGLAVGDHVVTCPTAFCGHCEWCLRGHPSLCDRLGLDRGPTQPPRLRWQGRACGQAAGLGSFAELMVVHQHALATIRKDVPLDVVAPIGCAVLTGVGAVWHTAGVEPGSTVAVVGCGGVGLNCIQGASLAGARRIVAIDTNPAKLALAEQFGATDVVDASAVDPVVAVRDLLPGRTSAGVDYSFEAIGRPHAAEQAFDMLRKRGTATVIGVMPPGTKIPVGFTGLIGERRIQGSALGSNRFREDVPRLLDLYAAGRLKLNELVSSRIALDAVNEGFAALEGGDGARAVIVFDQGGP